MLAHRIGDRVSYQTPLDFCCPERVYGTVVDSLDTLSSFGDNTVGYGVKWDGKKRVRWYFCHEISCVAMTRIGGEMENAECTACNAPGSNPGL